MRIGISPDIPPCHGLVRPPTPAGSERSEVVIDRAKPDHDKGDAGTQIGNFSPPNPYPDGGLTRPVPTLCTRSCGNTPAICIGGLSKFARGTKGGTSPFWFRALAYAIPAGGSHTTVFISAGTETSSSSSSSAVPVSLWRIPPGIISDSPGIRRTLVPSSNSRSTQPFNI